MTWIYNRKALPILIAILIVFDVVLDGGGGCSVIG